MGLLATPAAWAEIDNHAIVDVVSGVTDFQVEGETFRVVTDHSLSIVFEGVSADRVWGTIIHGASLSPEAVQLVWFSENYGNLILYEDTPSDTHCDFDSDEVTGHNEK